MRPIAALMILLVAAGPASAISRYQSQALSCASIQTILQREGAAVLRYPSTRVSGLTLYDRYVRSQSQCFAHTVTEQTTIPAKDGPCPVLHCIQEQELCDDFFSSVFCR